MGLEFDKKQKGAEGFWREEEERAGISLQYKSLIHLEFLYSCISANNENS